MKNKYYQYWHPKFRIVQEMIHLLYSLDKCVCGGCCHIVTDDDNIYDDDLDFVIKYCQEDKNKDRIDIELSEMICRIMKQMTFEQRAFLCEIMNSDIDLEIIDEDDFLTAVLMLNQTPEEIFKKFDHRHIFYKEDTI